MKRITILFITLACTIFSVLSRQARNPYVNALRLHGNVSCVKIYHQWWETKFGERVNNTKNLKATLYYDKNHRLLHVASEDNPYNYFYEYKYNDDGTLSTIDCYSHSVLTPTNYELKFKIKLVKENNTTVGYLYEGVRGTEEWRLSPYNTYPRYDGFWEPYPVPGDNIHNLQNYLYIFAFEIKSAPMRQEDQRYANLYKYKYEYNSKGQLSIISDEEPLGKDVLLSYDSKGNVISMDIHKLYGSREDKGSLYTFEYEYGNFEASEKYRREHYLNQIAQKEYERVSIAEEKRFAEEKEKRLAEERAIDQKWTQCMPEMEEFAQALTDADVLNAKAPKHSLGKKQFSSYKEMARRQETIEPSPV